MWIIDDSVRELVSRIDNCESGHKLDELLLSLVALLKERCLHPEVTARYAQYVSSSCSGASSPCPAVGSGDDSTLALSRHPLAQLPVDEDGYIVGFDPLTQEAEFVECWQRYGIVVGANVVDATLCRAVVERMHELMLAASEGACDLAKPDTWDSIPTDGAAVPIVSRGFFEIYHDDVIAAIRQSVRVYLHYVLIWGRADLWVTFDRLGIKLPGHVEGKGLPLHVDQNPNVHPQFRTVQGVLTLVDCPSERGTFVGVPGSREYFSVYGGMAKNKGEYVELDLSHPLSGTLSANAQLCPLRAGRLISWDSRTTHANSENVSDETRFVAYIAFGPQRQDDEAACAARADGFTSGLGSNVRDALMHASKKPRYTDQARLAALRRVEQLTSLGRLIYGQDKYL